jgi:hypothetical protein
MDLFVAFLEKVLEVLIHLPLRRHLFPSVSKIEGQ